MDNEMTFDDLLDVYKKENPEIALEVDAALMEVDIRTELIAKLKDKDIPIKQM